MTNKHEALTQAISQRTEEIAGYQTNIDIYTALVASIPSEYPQHLLEFCEADINALNLKEADMLLLSDLQFSAKMKRTLLTEKMEQQKAKHILQVLINQLGELNV